MTTSVDKYNVPITAANKECIELLDSAIEDMYGWKGTPSQKLRRSIEIDPHFVMGNIMCGTLELLGGVPMSNAVKECAKNLEGAPKDLTFRERKHIEAFQCMKQSNYIGAAQAWEAILIQHPTDLLALKFVYDIYFYLGDSIQIRDSVGRVYGTWKEGYKATPIYANIMGMYSFGLEETNYFTKAEKLGRRAVELAPNDAWAAHAVAHVLEMETRIHEGISWIEDTHHHWKESVLGRHNSWHKALFQLEISDYENALATFDKEIWPSHSSQILDLVDASSFLFRCRIWDIDVGDRWDSVIGDWMDHMSDHVLAFNDAHLMMTLGACRKEMTNPFLQSMRSAPEGQDVARDGIITQDPIYRDVGIALADAISHFSDGDHQHVLDVMMPLRSQIHRIGGSHAQRDVFHQMILRSALETKNAPLAEALCSERVQLRPKSPMSWKMYGQALQSRHASRSEHAYQRHRDLLSSTVTK